MKILNFGSLNLDYVYQVPHFVRPGETLSSTDYAVHLGGKGLNQSIALARAGCEVFHAGRIGRDGEALRAALQKDGVRTDFLFPDEGANGHAIIQVNASGENCILLYGGSNQKITRAQIDETLSHFEPGDLLLLQNEINEMPYIIEAAHRAGLTIALNPSPWSPEIPTWPLEYVRYFLVNEIEGAALAESAKSRAEGSSPAEDADTAASALLSAIRAQYPNSAVILTLGSHGAWYDDGQDRFFQPAFRVPVVDTTAAGDTFTGYFLASLNRSGMNASSAQKSEALKTAALAASIAVSRAGASPSVPYRNEVDEALSRS